MEEELARGTPRFTPSQRKVPKFPGVLGLSLTCHWLGSLLSFISNEEDFPLATWWWEGGLDSLRRETEDSTRPCPSPRGAARLREGLFPGKTVPGYFEVA